MDLPGFRNAPSLVYASFTPSFFMDAGNTPTGGFFRDWRASSLATQAQEPFVTSFEMANQNAAEVISRLQSSSATLAAFVAAYGSEVLEAPATALADIGLAIAAFETEDPSFHPFTSKYDYWLAGQAQLTAKELQGLALFNNPGKGNCLACHPSYAQGYSSHALFTDFTYDNIGIPRSWSIPANDPSPVSPIDGVPLGYVPAPLAVPAGAEYVFYDLGLCAPFIPAPTDLHPRPNFSGTTSLCGLFKAPTLRDAAITAPYFHNGTFKTLREVVEWYVTRDINSNIGNNPTPVPAGLEGNPYAPTGSFYTSQNGAPDLYEYNDLPVDFDANVNIGETPYAPPTIEGGQAPTLSSLDCAANAPRMFQTCSPRCPLRASFPGT
jgi:cytochrome c peroxidase